MTVTDTAGRTASPRPAGPSLESADRTLASRIAGVAGYLEQLRDRRQRGALAELRRLQPRSSRADTARPSEMPGETFWSLVYRYDLPRGEEDFWLAALPLMVRHSHQRGTRPGRALEAAGISKARFERWLRLDREGALREAPRLLSKLRDESLDWVDLGRALYRWSDEDRYRLAREFFLARERRERTHTDGAA